MKLGLCLYSLGLLILKLKLLKKTSTNEKSTEKAYCHVRKLYAVYNTLYHKYPPSDSQTAESKVDQKTPPLIDVRNLEIGEFPCSTDCVHNAGPTVSTKCCASIRPFFRFTNSLFRFYLFFRNVDKKCFFNLKIKFFL